jgi:hypothetical protein
MTADECNMRAAECAENAAIAVDGSVCAEFLRMAARWRAMAVRDIFLGYVDVAAPPISVPQKANVAEIIASPLRPAD